MGKRLLLYYRNGRCVKCREKIVAICQNCESRMLVRYVDWSIGVEWFSCMKCGMESHWIQCPNCWTQNPLYRFGFNGGLVTGIITEMIRFPIVFVWRCFVSVVVGIFEILSPSSGKKSEVVELQSEKAGLWVDERDVVKDAVVDLQTAYEAPITCPQCHRPGIYPRAASCPGCGANLQSLLPVTCPRCGRPGLSPTAPSCPGCGMKFREI